MSESRMIITAASESYGSSLLAMLGSLNLNWPGHPPVRVYDIGLHESTASELRRHGIDLVGVPAFVPHWRKHFTWKLWCLNESPAENVLWLDAGLAVLRPLDEIFHVLDAHGYFLVPNYQLLDWEASDAACRGCGLHPSFRLGKHVFAANIMGFKKRGVIADLLREALEVGKKEENIKASKPSHRHDQAIISLLVHKHIPHAVPSDGILYGGWKSPAQAPRQKVWAHRRKIHSEDVAHFAQHISAPGEPYMPVHYKASSSSPMHRNRRSRLASGLVRLARRLLVGRQERSRQPYGGVRL